MPQIVRLAGLLLIGLALPAFAALESGTRAPLFEADAYLDGEPLRFSLGDALETGPVIVYFFPAAHTPGCNLEARLFSEAMDRFQARGAKVIGVTAGNTDQLADFSRETEHCAGRFPVAADPGAKIAGDYDAVLEGKPEWASRTSYAIGADGRVIAVHADPNPAGHVKAMLEALPERD